ncbi:hypothetical protein SJ05684_b52680 (plasmid) [Sinorhizobium sojae CCBAU 05684]|uniref:Invasion protein B, involved in pathogenesis n=1 Tax=Sinorhizobium sojae CCBAU 05684 TaxID=716928 RepID=A0A249PJX5_9HYPH|nr:hypothetical protein SJ05684_b52680 [Sinorhizobium sojae CCBAU 05684]
MAFATAAAAQEAAAPTSSEPPAVTTQRFDDWNHRCAQVDLGEGKTAMQCEVVQVAHVKQGDEDVSLLTLAIASAAPEDSAQKKTGADTGLALTALVPLNIFLPAGFGLDADGKAIVDMVYRNCNQAGCWTQQRLDKAVLTALQKGQVGAARMRLMNGQNVTIRFSLKGLTAALNKLNEPTASN